jgi:flagellar protein FlaI
MGEEGVGGGAEREEVEESAETVEGAEGEATEEKGEAQVLREYSILEEPRVAVRVLEDVDGRRFYHVEEPPLTDAGNRVYQGLITRILGDMRLLRRFSELEDLGEGLREAYKLAKPALRKWRGKLRKAGVDPEQEAMAVAYYIARDLVGYGRLDPLIRDPHIEDISCNGLYTPVFVYHSEFEWLTTSIAFNDRAELERVVMKLALRSGREPSLARPIVEGVLRPEGYRVHIILDVVSRRGHSFTIRKFRAEPFTIVELLRRRTLDEGVAAALWAAIQYKQGVVIYGPTGSGKTTLLNALAMLLPPEYKIVTIEDTPEIYIPFHDNWAAMHTRFSDMPGVQNVTLQTQVESALRMRPDVIIVGEIRSLEAFAFFQALATGHLDDVSAGRQAIAASIERQHYEPQDGDAWDEAYIRFLEVIRAATP